MDKKLLAMAASTSTDAGVSFVQFMKTTRLGESLCKMAAFSHDEVVLLQDVAIGEEVELRVLFDALFDRLPELSDDEDTALRGLLSTLPQVIRSAAVLGWGLSQLCPEER